MNTPGEQIITALLETPARRHFSVRLERKAGGPILGAPANPMPVPRVIPGPVVPLRMRDLIPVGTTEADSIGYPRETSITNSVVIPTPVGGLKPQAGLTYDMQTAPVRTIPAYMKMSAQLWEDYAAFQSWIDARLLYSLTAAEEVQLISGNGVAPNLQGLLLVAINTATVAGAGGVAVLDNIAAGVAATFARGYAVDGIVVNPADWGKALTVKAAVGGAYLLGEPSDMPQSFSLWGLPVVLSVGMPSGSYVVGQFNPYSQIFDRDAAAVEVAEQNQDDFVKNLVTVRAEERLAFAIYQPGAFSKGTFTP
jgi:HK97 family phage major capsid protein